jgi:hypothetical protein
MQEPTHILTGAIIQKAFERKRPRALWLGVTAVLAFLSHGVLDKLSRVTYHPADPDFHSAIWVGYHSCVLLFTVFFLYLWWKPCKWGIIFACLPDVDWVFIHGQEILHVHLPFYRTPHLHHLLGLMLDHTPPFTLIDKLPNYRHQPWAGVWELVLVLLLAALLYGLNRRKVVEKPAR